MAGSIEQQDGSLVQVTTRRSVQNVGPRASERRAVIRGIATFTGPTMSH
jgi:hypothetical protein